MLRAIIERIRTARYDPQYRRLGEQGLPFWVVRWIILLMIAGAVFYAAHLLLWAFNCSAAAWWAMQMAGISFSGPLSVVFGITLLQSARYIRWIGQITVDPTFEAE